MVDVDVGDCFLSFMLHPTLMELAGVDHTHYFGKEGQALWGGLATGCNGSKVVTFSGCECTHCGRQDY
jgi:hypothetical protein